ncbi:MAG: response regulator [Magnetococcales bacterium]|nr:response regulator [Magnetococcales bacterium]
MDNALSQKQALQTILVVDDEANNISILNEILQNKFQILFSLNGPDAINLCEKYKPDLILMDIIMPDMSGYEVCKILKNNPKTAEIPIIFISALEYAQDKLKGLEVGGVGYIAKPFEVEEVQACINKYIA